MKYKIKESPYKPQKEGITLSQSSIGTMEKCHHEYYLRYIEKIKVPHEAPYLAFGNMIHLIAENYTGSGQEELKELFNQFQTDEKLKKQYWDKLDKDCRSKTIQALRHLYLWMKDRRVLDKNYVPEKNLDFYNIDEVDGKAIHLTGKLDGYYKYKNKTFITDFKTGKKLKNHSEQLGFYLYILFRLNKNILSDTEVVGEIVNVALDHDLPHENIVEYYELEEFDIIRADNRVNKAISTLKRLGIKPEDKKNWKKKPQRLCDWCDYKKAGICNGRHDSEEDFLKSLDDY
jgi:RecB family exonuclease